VEGHGGGAGCRAPRPMQLCAGLHASDEQTKGPFYCSCSVDLSPLGSSFFGSIDSNV
jgi:hypothetical protein